MRIFFAGGIVLGCVASANAAVIGSGPLSVGIHESNGAIDFLSFGGTEFYELGAPVSDYMFQVGTDTGTFTIFRENGSVSGVAGSGAGVAFSDADSAIVTGTYGPNVDFRREYDVLDDNTLQVSTTIENFGSTTTFAFAETFDPDQGVPLGLGFGTFNDIISIGGSDWAKAWVDSGVAGDGDGLTGMIGGATATLSFGIAPTSFGLGISSGTQLNAFFAGAPADPNGAFSDVGYSIGFMATLGESESATFTYFHRYGRTMDEASPRVPEPASIALLGLGLLGLGAVRRKK